LAAITLRSDPNSVRSAALDSSNLLAKLSLDAKASPSADVLTRPAVIAAPRLLAAIPNPLNQLPVDNRLPQIRAVLDSKNLSGSYAAHLKEQLRTKGYISVAVVDDFKNGTHGRNVEQRILANVPSYLRDKVRIVRYDVGGLDAKGRAAVITRAANDASNKKFVALSLSGGMDAYNAGGIGRAMGQPLNSASAGRGFEALASKNKMSKEERAAWSAISAASKRIPVVTPVWNDGNTTLGALAAARSNGIVTTIDQHRDSLATQIPLHDIRMPAQPFSNRTSQSAPTFIGQSLGLLKESDTRSPVPTPRDSGYRNGGLPV
jgi:hypothetical protein